VGQYKNKVEQFSNSSEWKSSNYFSIINAVRAKNAIFNEKLLNNKAHKKTAPSEKPQDKPYLNWLNNGKKCHLERIAELRNIIEYHNKRYYQQDNRIYLMPNMTADAGIAGIGTSIPDDNLASSLLTESEQRRQ